MLLQISRLPSHKGSTNKRPALSCRHLEAKHGQQEIRKVTFQRPGKEGHTEEQHAAESSFMLQRF